MSEEKLIDPVVSRLEPQILDYVEVRHPQNTANLLQIVDKYEERFMNRQIRGSSERFRSSNPNENNRFNNRHRQENWRENRNNERYANNNRRQREFNRFENQGFANNRRFEGRRQGGQSEQRFHNQGGRQKKSLIIPDNQIKQLPKIEKPVDIDLTDSKLGDGQQRQLKDLFNNFKELFSDQPGLTHVLYHEIDTGDKGPVVSRPYSRSNTKENDLPTDSPEAYRFAIDYRKLNVITKYPRYLLPVINDLLTNIPHTGIMFTQDLRSGYFQLAISPKDIEKMAFITRNGTFAILRMPFGLSGPAPNFQKAIDIILKPVIGRFVLVYMDDVIITLPSFKDHLDHLNQVFTLLRDAGLTLNKEKCHFARDKLKYLGLIISKDGIETDSNKIRAITEMRPPKNNREVSKCLGMTGWYQKFIPRYADICEPLYQLKKKGAKFNWSKEAQDSFDQIKRTLTEAPILQLPNFSEQFNLFNDASGVGMGAVLQQNQKPILLSRLEPLIKQNVTIRLPKENVWR
ncbi:retrovirus-related Pol polyprotein from transposon 297 [Trichonephila clavipes]|nr:retrovirus-related Pol polyprotein from transposon 297 [Trichonephila clavipes]